MARPRQHATAAAKQAAYRNRLAATTLLVDRHLFEQFHEQLAELQTAVREASERGDGFARQCSCGNVVIMLENMVAAFRAAAPAAPKPVSVKHRR